MNMTSETPPPSIPPQGLTEGRFRKKPVVINAVQFTRPCVGPPQHGEMFIEWPVLADERGVHVDIPTLEGVHRADLGDWIITGVKGEKYPCKPDIFAATYEPAVD